MPGTGVFVRTSINQTVGATCRLSQFMNALMVMIITCAAMPIFGYLPMATIAAMLMVASVRMVPNDYIAMLWRQDPVNFCLCILVAIICALVDCVIGVVVGMFIAFLMGSMQQQTAEKVVTHHYDQTSAGRAVVVVVRGPVTYSSAEALLTRGSKAAVDGAHHIVDVGGVTQVDTDGLDALYKLISRLSAAAGDADVEVRGASGEGHPASRFAAWWDLRPVCAEARAHGCEEPRRDTVCYDGTDGGNAPGSVPVIVAGAAGSCDVEV